jgi:4'-phosphopantetheinyl transferase
VRDREIGVDLEQHRQVLDYERIALRFFSATERRDLMSVPSAIRPSAFFDCWTRKEAFVKAIGGGLSIPLDSFGVSLMPEQPAALLNVAGSAREASEWTIQAFLPAPGFSGAVALRCCRPHVHVRHMDVQEVFVSAGLF